MNKDRSAAGALCAVGASLVSTVVITLAALAAGCASQPGLPPANAATGTSIEKIEAHVSSAEQVNQRITPHADATGQELVKVASTEHKAAEGEIVNAQKENAQQAAAYEALVNKYNADLKAANDRAQKNLQRALDDEATIGFRAELWIKRFLWILAGAAVLHILLAVASFVLPMIFPAALPAVPALSLAAKIINPFGVFTWLAAAAGNSAARKAAALANSAQSAAINGIKSATG